MIRISNELEEELPSFCEYMKHMHNNKKMYVIGNQKGMVVPLNLLRKELFMLEDETNKQISPISVVSGSITAKTMLEELKDPKRQHLYTFPA